MYKQSGLSITQAVFQLNKVKCNLKVSSNEPTIFYINEL